MLKKNKNIILSKEFLTLLILRNKNSNKKKYKISGLK